MVNAVQCLSEYKIETNKEGNEEIGKPEFLIVYQQKQGFLATQSIREFLKLSKFKPTGINKREALMSSMRSNQALQVSALVGRQVLVKKDSMFLGIEGAVFAAIEIPQGINNLVISIYHKSGESIKQIVFSQPREGFFHFSWDGTGQDNQRLSAGRYRIGAHGNYRGEERILRTLALANIDSVSLGKDGRGVKLNIAGVGLVDLEG